MLRLRTFGGLWVENPGNASEAGPRPRSLALLAMLAAAGLKGVSRDRVLGVLWSESDAERARHSLSQTIYSLRRELGVEVILSTPDLKLDAGLIASDVDDFRQGVLARKWDEAAALYVGPFADGFFLADAPEFERWAESERASLASEGARALQLAAKASAERGKVEEAAEYWRRLTRLEPVNARVAFSYMEALSAIGDRAAALAHGKAHIELLKKEFDAQPSREIVQLIARLRNASGEGPTEASRPRQARREPATTETLPPSAPSNADTPSPPTRIPGIPRIPRIPARTLWVGAAALTVVLAIALIGWRSAIAARTERPVLAVGRIKDLTSVDSGEAVTLLSEMLATSLGRINDLQVVANSRMVELTPRGAETSRTRITDAAHRAGATELIEGELMPLAGALLRLQARRVSLDRGFVRSGYRIVGTDRMALFDSLTSLIAADLRVPSPSGSLAEVSTRSPVAYRFYEEGLRAFLQFDTKAANRLFRAAIREDSTFPMGTYYAWRSAVMSGDTDQYALAEHAEALASRASPRDRLLILTHVRFTRSDVRAAVSAESLATRFPRDPETLIRAAEATAALGRAMELLDRSIALDSAAGGASGALCRLCDALLLLEERYAWADSEAAAERTLRRWSALRPRDAQPWAVLADHFISMGQRARADAAVRRFEALGGSRTGMNLASVEGALRLDDAQAANAECNEGLASPDASVYLQFEWYCTIALRMQGRYAEALALVRDDRIPNSRFRRHTLTTDSTHLAILHMEMAQPLLAADEFLALDRPYEEDVRIPEGLRARNLTWHLTLAATAAVAGGDTVRARHMIDTIERVGQRSLFARDPRLHHFVRGLLLSRAQRHDTAVKEFRAAMNSPTFGYTRINYEMARSLLALNRPAAAIGAVQPALRGGLDGSNLYVTRTELHELLAQAFDANRQRDSALVHYAIVERAWRSADPVFRPRYEAVRARLKAFPIDATP